MWWGAGRGCVVIATGTNSGGAQLYRVVVFVYARGVDCMCEANSKRIV